MATKRKRPAVGQATQACLGAAATRQAKYARVREIAHALPGVQDATSYGTPALKVRGKLLARLHQSLDCLVLRADYLDRQILMQVAPDVYFLTDHYQDYPWILVRLAQIEDRALPELIERSWRLVAPKALQAQYDASPARAARPRRTGPRPASKRSGTTP